MRKLRPAVALLTGLALAGCAQGYVALEALNHDLCRRHPTTDCRDNGYVRAGAAILEDPYFGHAPRAPSDLGEPAAL